MPFPKTVAEVDILIQQNVQENFELDYKSSSAISKSSSHKNEMAKDASALANSGGGVLLYGVEEDQNHDPVRRDGGVNHLEFPGEWIEQILQSTISPRLSGVEIIPIRVSDTHSYYSVFVPKSYRGPHQDRITKKYYRRFGYNVMAMEDYEINDVRNRMTLYPPLVNFAEESHKRVLCYLVVENVGAIPAYDLTFDFSPELRWRDGKEKPQAFQNGIRCLPPRKKLYFFYYTFPEMFGEGSQCIRSFEVGISYLHPQLGYTLRDRFIIDMEDYRDSMSVHSDVYGLGEILDKRIPELTKVVEGLDKTLKELLTLRGSTGLDLSLSTIRSLESILKGQDPFQPFDPRGFSHSAFQKVLSVDWELAMQLYQHFWNSDITDGIDDLPGMNPEILGKFFKHFKRRTAQPSAKQ
ncbi:MAG: AlbA family DNA-binding domain-containing protein [Bryobacteraceae bacterium]